MKIDSKQLKKIAPPFLAAVVLLLSVLGPEQLARYKDRSRLNKIIVEAVDESNEGYRYTLSSNEKLFLLAECLSHQTLPESEQSARSRTSVADVGYEGLLGTYAFVMNRQGSSGREITNEQIFQICNRELSALKELGVMPESVREVEQEAYSAVLYSAIDVLEPQKNMSVWRVSLSTSQQNVNKANRLIDAYIDADSGKIYSFYARTDSTWEELSPEKIMEEWSGYLGLTGREAYDTENPLLETTPNFIKYRFPGMDDGSTIVTIGFYDGINELFIKNI